MYLKIYFFKYRNAGEGGHSTVRGGNSGKILSTPLFRHGDGYLETMSGFLTQRFKRRTIDWGDVTRTKLFRDKYRFS